MRRKIRYDEVVGISNCGDFIFFELTMTLSCTRTSCSSDRLERFRLGDFAVKTEQIISNFVISLRTIDPHEASFLPKMIWSFRTVRRTFSIFVKCH